MKCSSRHNIFRSSSEDNYQGGMLESVKKLHDVGFQAIDLGFGSVGEPGYILEGDDWERKVDELANEAAKYGMSFSQLHMPSYKKGSEAADARFKRPGFKGLFDQSMERALIAGGKLGIPWAVAHCLNPKESGGDPDIAAKINHEYYDRYVECGIKHGVGFAFENMVQNSDGGGKWRYTGHYHELIDYVDSFNDPMVGICWDFGHANITGFDQCTALRKVGRRLKCLHIDDNFGNSDHHLIPFTGMIDWHKIMPVLAEIGYEGECNLEVQNHFKRMPRHLHGEMAKYAFEVCDYLRKLVADAAKKQSQGE